MPIDIQSLREVTLTIPITLRGQDYTARPLSAAESRAILQAFPRPEAAKGPDGKGGFAVLESDPRQQAAEAWHGMMIMATEILVGTGTIAIAQGAPALKVAAEELLDVVSETEVGEAWRAIRKGALTSRDDARKN